MKASIAMAKINQWIAWVIAAPMGLGFAAKAQTPASCTAPVALGALSGTLSLASLPTLGAPYTATVKTTEDKTLPDGTTAHASVTTYQARDAAGRLSEKRSLGCQPGPDGVRHLVLQTLIYDPSTGTTFSWKESDPTKELRVIHQPPRHPHPPAATTNENEQAARAAMEEMGIHEQDLGTRKIDGVVTDGSRTMTTNPAGKEVVDETWVAKDLDLQMLKIWDDPSTVRRTVEIVDLKQGPPDPALFTPPTGYTIVELNHPKP